MPMHSLTSKTDRTHMILYLALSILIAAAAFPARSQRHLFFAGIAFSAVQAGFAVRLLADGLYGMTCLLYTSDAADER